ncbi:hypothetical protein [Kitasatospora azatica]|uniref:hypothetical protein n=1 Tax=Kitasatospora azatica TaxID=58347 RepID=UPI0012F7E5BE|nr:hypothetical protein [Kitasatospora azatica]
MRAPMRRAPQHPVGVHLLSPSDGRVVERRTAILSRIKELLAELAEPTEDPPDTEPCSSRSAE